MEVYLQQRKEIFCREICCSDSRAADDSCLLGCDGVWMGESWRFERT